MPDSPPGRVLQALSRGQLVPVASWELAQEIAEVLRRPRLRRYGITEKDIEDVLRLLAPFLPTVEAGVPSRDPDDAPVVMAAIAAGADAIVTRDRDLHGHGPLRAWLAERGVAVYTPAELLNRLSRP